MTDSCKVLMIFPLFNAGSFWNYKETCDLTGAARHDHGCSAAPEALVSQAYQPQHRAFDGRKLRLGRYGDGRWNAAPA